MPSIEIMCIGQREPTTFGDLPFAVEADSTRQSHRPRPLFQPEFDANAGVLYHLGNPSLKRDSAGRAFFAWKLLSESSQESGEFLEFSEQFRPAVVRMVAELLRLSPEQRLLFTSDWQFGPEQAVRGPDTDLVGLWQLHDSHQLRFNALYPIVAARGSPEGV